MSPRPSTDLGTCPGCGATLPAPMTECWLCGAPLESRAGVAWQGPVDSERRAGYQFRLSTLMLTIALGAVLVDVFRMAPGLGIVLAIFAVPAFLRTCRVAARTKARGQRMSLAEKLAVFASTLGIVVVAVVASIVALAAVCLQLAAI